MSVNGRVQSGHSPTAAVVDVDVTGSDRRAFAVMLSSPSLPSSSSCQRGTATRAELGPPRGFDGLERDDDGISNVDGPGANIGGGRWLLVGSVIVALGSSSSPSSGALKFKSSSESGSMSGSMYSISES